MCGRRLYLKTENGHSAIEVAGIFPACYDFFSDVVSSRIRVAGGGYDQEDFPR